MRTAVVFFVWAGVAMGQPHWARMIWHAEKTGGKNVEHAVLLLEVQLDGVKCPTYMQLDTGCDADLVYGVPYDQLGRENPRAGQNQVWLSGAVAGSRFERERFYIRKQFGINWLSWWIESTMQRVAVLRGKPILLGTIGAEFFEQRVLLLDFVAGRAAILGKGEEIPAAMVPAIEFAPVEYRNHKMFVTVAHDGVKYRDLFFDTGSSAAAVVTTRRRWEEWTGRQPDDPHNSVMVAKAWDKDARLVGAPVKGELCVGGACAAGPVAMFESTGLESSDFERYPFETSGLIGNVLFDGRFTVVVDVAHRRFGLFAGSMANGAGRR